eukprot:5793146-Pleurochrysis_carterae.AAC.1
MTITPYTSTNTPVVVASREGIVRYTAGGRWEVIEEEGGGSDGTMIQYVQSPTLMDGFLIVSSIQPLLFS